MSNIFNDIIEKICKELKIEYQLLSNGWVIMLKKDGITKFITGNRFDLNRHGFGQVVDDKYAAYEVLKANQIKVIEHSLIYGMHNENPYAVGYNTISYLTKLFNQYNQDVVIKINSGACGNNVEHFNDLKALQQYFEKIADTNSSYSICPYYNIQNEFRSIVLDGQVKLIYKKEKPIVIGDGKSTINELLTRFNYHYFVDNQDDNLNSVLAVNEVYTYDWKFNLSKGARVSEEISTSDKEQVTALALEVANKLEVGFCSVDIVKIDNEFYILEINSGVTLKKYIDQASNGYQTTYNIYKEAVEKLFEVK